MFILFRLLANLFSGATKARTTADAGSNGNASSNAVSAQPFSEPAVSPASRGPLAQLAHQVRFDLLTQLRNPRARFLTMVFPLILLVIFNGVFGTGHTIVDHHRITLKRYYTPGIMAQAVVAAAYASMVISISTMREGGILKRRRATPVPAWILVAGQACTAAFTTIMMATVMLIVARLVYHVGFAPAAILAMYVMVLLSTISLGCISFAVAGLIKNADTAQPLVQATMLPLWFVSGVFLPTASLSKPLRVIGEIFPLEHLANSLHLASVNSSFGASISLVDVLVLAAWALVAIVVVVRRFSWLPLAA